MGAFHTSPVSTLQILCNEPPLHLRREELAINILYSIKLHSNPSNPTYNTVFYQQPSALFSTRRGAIRPLSLRIAPSYSPLNTNSAPVAVNKLYPVAPWTFKTATVLLDLATNTKSNTALEVYKTLYCELKQQYPYYQEIFTDGSKSTNQVCAAAVVLSSKLAFSTKLPRTTSIFTAELLAIHLAL